MPSVIRHLTLCLQSMPYVHMSKLLPASSFGLPCFKNITSFRGKEARPEVCVCVCVFNCAGNHASAVHRGSQVLALGIV